MPTAGKARLFKVGKRSLRTTGKAQLFTTSGRCSECCTPYVLASFVTNGNTAPCWSLTPYQGTGRATPCAFWRLIETGSCYPGGYPWYGAGCVDSTGRLVGLPSQFCTSYYYNGYMQLQIGCRSASGTQINWPGSCQSTSSVYSCSQNGSGGGGGGGGGGGDAEPVVGPPDPPTA